MSKTVDELIGVYIEASNAVVWEAEKRGLCPMTLDMQRAGIAAVVRAVRDELCVFYEDEMVIRDTWELYQEFNEILGVAESEKASGSGPASVHTQEQRPGPQVAGSAKTVDAQQCQTNTTPATDPIRNAVAMARGRTLAVDDIPTLNKLAAMMSPATDHAPAVCEWTASAASGLFSARCQPHNAFVRPIDNCHLCGLPIKFTEAKT